jgi:hypothetical protein
MMRSFLVLNNHPDLDSAARRHSLALHQITAAAQGQEQIGLESKVRGDLRKASHQSTGGE